MKWYVYILYPKWFRNADHNIYVEFRYAEEKQREAAKLEKNNNENVEAKHEYATASNRAPSKFIKLSMLYKQMSEKRDTLLLMDCRSADAFAESNVKFPNMINIPEEIIHKGFVTSKSAF